MNGKVAVITGGAGFIGSNLAIRLTHEGARVTVVDAMFPDLGGNLFNLHEVEREIRFELGDIRDARLMRGVLADADYVFNLAGNVSHSDSMRDPIFDHSVNSEAQLRFLELCRAHASGAVIVFTSTRQIYGVPRYLPVDEDHPISPVDVNGIDKLAAEHFHTLYASYYGLRTVSLRLTNTYGPRQLIRHARQGFVAWFMNRSVLAQPIQLFGGGAQLRDFTFVDDVCDALICAATTPTCIGQVYNLAGEKASLATLAESLVAISGGKTRLERVPFPPDKKKIDIGDYYGTYARFHKVTNWLPKTPLHEGLAMMYDFYTTNSHHYLP